jgi:hypothetical protein
VTLTRAFEDSDSASMFSTLTVSADGTVIASGVAVELDDDDHLLADGTYSLSPYSSPSHGAVFMVNDPVSRLGRDMDSDGLPVEFHKGNFGYKNGGCISPGTSLQVMWGEVATYQSGVALSQMNAALSNAAVVQLKVVTPQGVPALH